jgi:hypothetical protein
MRDVTASGHHVVDVVPASGSPCSNSRFVAETGVSTKAKAAFDLRRAQTAHVLLRGIDWSAFDCFWTEAGTEWSRRHESTPS